MAFYLNTKTPKAIKRNNLALSIHRQVCGCNNPTECPVTFEVVEWLNSLAPSRLKHETATTLANEWLSKP